MKNLVVSQLLDFYGDMLTDKQRSLIIHYYDDDLSLSEIAENEGISRQGVRDALKRAENLLLDIEEKLNLYEKHTMALKSLERIKTIAKAGEDISDEIDKLLKYI